MAAPGSGRARESIGGVLGLALGCLLVIWGLAGPFFTSEGPEPVDGLDLLAESFELGELPFGATLHSADRMPDGRVMIYLTPASAVEASLSEGGEIPATEHDSPVGPEQDQEQDPEQNAESGPRAEDQGMGRGMGMHKPWPGLVPGEAAEPLEILLVQHPERLAERALQRSFRDLRYKDLKQVDDKGETIPLDAGETRWGVYDVRWVHLRAFALEKGRPTFHDILRVNLTLDRKCWILHLRWGEFVPGSLEDARAVLAAVQPPVQLRVPAGD